MLASKLGSYSVLFQRIESFRVVSLRLFLLVLITLVCRELSNGQEPTADFNRSALGLVGLTLGFGLLSKLLVLRRLAASGPIEQFDKQKRRELAEQTRGLKNWILTFWAILFPLVSLANGWVDWCVWLSASKHSGLLGLGLLFVPTVFFLSFWDSIEADVDSACIDGQEGWAASWLLRTRLGDTASLVTCMVPVILITGLNDFSPVILPATSEASRAAIATAVAGMLILLVYPMFMSSWYGGRPVTNGKLQARIEALRIRSKVGAIQNREIPSSGKWQGAALVGWLPGLRQLWLGDGLLDQLSDEEIDMVVLHEFAHVKHMHFLWRMTPVIWTAGLSSLMFFGLEWVSESTIPNWMTNTLTGVFSIASILLGLGFVSWQCEFEADRSACLLAEQSCDWAKGQPGAPVMHLTSALCKLTGGTDAASKTWLHPCLKDRLKNLAAFLNERRREISTATT